MMYMSMLGLCIRLLSADLFGDGGLLVDVVAGNISRFVGLWVVLYTILDITCQVIYYVLG